MTETLKAGGAEIVSKPMAFYVKGSEGPAPQRRTRKSGHMGRGPAQESRSVAAGGKARGKKGLRP